MSQRYNIIN